ncbi:ParB N-terminal domain-containing protein [Paraburkholderia sp. Ac-20340]|uniref:ParB/RepB/Spo0J family partition protein n=1 Tax=Paraburkholderia sp. Ac-20340 TaxID=2703888 RepID=UPI00197F84C9|nr:ParB/RepB/Spo0J family partition protein [Paraburkholderia sp. Ac-20340]MBN3856702.1 ParB N-terminal domain-containing protein [Paraburkholderia sp. Ac-20340]
MKDSIPAVNLAASQPDLNGGRIEYVAYSRLALSPLNVRKKAPGGIEALAETIHEKGLIQNLVVHELEGRTKLPRLGVCAGQRRLAALDLLFEQDRIAKDYLVPVLVVSEGEALATSLIENREREDMHIADECVAFRLLMEEGKSVAHIAALFKIPEVAVRRALKIANLAPALLDLLRDDGLDFEQAKALVLADDHATQERIWNEAVNGWQRRPAELRAAITREEIDARENALARFVGLDAYEAAGGRVRRDLFSVDEHAGYIEDAELLHRLASDRLIELSQAVAAEGWSFVETRTRYEPMEIMRHGRVGSTTRKPTKKEKTELAELTATRDAAQGELDAYYDDDGEPDEVRQERLEAAATAATYAVDQYVERFETFDAEDMKRAGAYVYLDGEGRVCIERGLVRREATAVAEAGGSHPGGAMTGVARAPKERPLHGEKLCRRLTAHRTAAVQVELAQQPGVALAVLMQRMIPVVFDDLYGEVYINHAVKIDVHTSRDALVSSADDMAEALAWKEMEAERSKWANLLPRRADELLPWLLQQDTDVMSNLFAFCVAATVDGISGVDRPHPVNEVANTLAVDLARYWKPTRAGYFDHVPKDRIVAVVGESVSPQAAGELRGMKKGDAATVAERRMTDSGWLPEVLRNRAVPERVTYGWREDDDDVDGDDAGSNEDEASDAPAEAEGEDAVAI